MQSLIAFLRVAMPEFVKGTWISLRLAAGALVIGLLLGLMAALARVYGRGVLRHVAGAYIEFFRGVPLLVQLFVIYYGLPQVGIVLPAMTAAYLALGINSGAYQAEYFRGALQAIESGQMLAARSIGMTKLQAIRHIIIPQALRLALPAWSNEPVSMIKYTAVVYMIAVPDLMTKAKILGSRYFNPIESYLAATLIYLLLVAAMSLVMHYVDRRLHIPGLDMGNKGH